MTDRPTPWTEEQRLIDPPATDRESFGNAFERIVGIMARLRAPGGCPWDREQDLGTLRAYLIEEAYEVLESMEEDDVAAHREELGDLLLQIVFQAEIRREEGAFDAAHVCHGIADKLVRRHPHVFGEEVANEAKEAFVHWEAKKAEEKKGRSVIDGVPRALPALLRAQRIQEKASRVGFDWNNVEGPLQKLDEEMAELKEAIRAEDSDRVADELGDVLFTLVNAARFLEVGAEDALSGTVSKFAARFTKIEKRLATAERSFAQVPLEELEQMWQAAKAGEDHRS